MTAPIQTVLGDAALLLLRLGAGGMLLGAHGWPKLMSFAERAETFSDPLGVGPAASLSLVVFAEVFCAGLVMLGALTRGAAVPVVLMMTVAVFIQHADDPWSSKELPLLYLFVFLTFVLAGGGRWSVDRLIRHMLGRRRDPGKAGSRNEARRTPVTG